MSPWEYSREQAKLRGRDSESPEGWTIVELNYLLDKIRKVVADFDPYSTNSAYRSMLEIRDILKDA